MADIKNFLYAWCGKKKLTPNYDIRAAGNKNRQKFLCEVRIRPRPLKATCKLYIKILYNQRCFFVLNHVLFKVRLEGYNYIGMGNSTNKKDAQSNAARDFVNYLVRTKEVSRWWSSCSRGQYHICVYQFFHYSSVLWEVWLNVLFSGQRTWWREWRRWWWWVWKSPIQLSTPSTSDCEEGIGGRYLMFYLYMHPVIGC